MYEKITFEDMKKLRRRTQPLITQGDMARHLNCSTKTIERYESGDTELSQVHFSKYWAYCHNRVRSSDEVLSDLKARLLSIFKLT